MANTLTPTEQRVISTFSVTGGRNAAHNMPMFNNYGLFMDDEHGRNVVFLHTGFGLKHGQWTVTETVYDMLGRAWNSFSRPMVMDDFGTLFELSQ